MGKTTTETVRSLAEIKAAIMAGDQSVTADELARARADDELAALQAEAERQLAAHRAETERHARIRGIVDHLAAVLDSGHKHEGLALIREGVRLIAADHVNQLSGFRMALAALAAEGIRYGGEPVAGVTLSHAYMGRPDAVTVDGAHVFPTSPGMNIAEAIDDGLRDAGARRATIEPGVTITPRPRRRVETDQQRQQREQLAAAARARIAEQEAAKRG